MKKLASLALVAVVAFASSAFAGEWTAEELMQKLATCESCKPFMEYPELGPNIRYDMLKTANGFVASFMLADEKLIPKLKECTAKCEKTRTAAMNLSPAEQKEKLCPFCAGMFEVMARKDVVIEEFTTKLGTIVVASSNTKQGVEALHHHAAVALETNALLEEAAAKMMRGEKY